MATKKETLDWFRSQLGYKEGPRKNQNKFAALAGHKNFLAWCASFMVAGFRAVGMRLPNESAWTPSMLLGLQKAGRSIGGPQVGALAFLYFPSLRRVAHVGIVEKVRPDGRFETIEGNTDVKGGRTGGRVMRKVRSPRGFTFVMPHYDEEKPSTAKPADNRVPDRARTAQIQKALELTPVDGLWGRATDERAILMRTAARAKVGFPRPVVERFNVRNVQTIVDVKADGIWGPATQAAMVAWVKTFQKILGLPADGQWGPQTDATFVGFRKQNLNNF